MNPTKVFFVSLFTALVLAAPLAWLYDYIFPSRGGGFDIGNLIENPYIATIVGLIFSLSLSLGFFGTLYFGNRYKQLALFIIIPTFLADLIYGVDGNIWDFIIPFSMSLLTGLIGVGLGFLVRFLSSKLKS